MTEALRGGEVIQNSIKDVAVKHYIFVLRILDKNGHAGSSQALVSVYVKELTCKHYNLCSRNGTESIDCVLLSTSCIIL